MAKTIIQEYLENIYLQESLLNEGLSDFIGKLTPEKIKDIFKNLQGSISKGNLENAYAHLKSIGIKMTSIDKIEELGEKIDPKYKEVYQDSKALLSAKVPKLKDDYLNIGSIAVSLYSIYQDKENPKKSLHDNVNKFSNTFLGLFKEKSEEKVDMPKGVFLEFAIGWALLLSIVILYGKAIFYIAIAALVYWKVTIFGLVLILIGYLVNKLLDMIDKGSR